MADMRRGPAGRRPAILALVLVLAAFVAPGAALAQGDEIRLALRPVGQAGLWFDLTMRPGETRRLEVEISNKGAATISARTYASDVYTIVNGGFGGSLRGEPKTATTRWLDYATDVVSLQPGNGVRRSFTVAVPTDAEPGEFITSVVVENDKPIHGEGTVVLDQIVRQALAVVVTVPGPRLPGLKIGEATHKVVAGTSMVAVAVRNTGNIRLKPIVEFVLTDAAGAPISRARVQMDTFYARTDTFVEVALATPLPPGTYTVRLTLGDQDQGASADRDGIVLVVAPLAAPDDPAASGTVTGLPPVNPAPADGTAAIPAWWFIVGGGILAGVLGLGLIALLVIRRSRPGASDR